ncbi:amidohydrolase [Candidatus Uhrbacteria bacterium]|nr:amidohydrolase [Candidatus Uhrbacteria bacterium]
MIIDAHTHLSKSSLGPHPGKDFDQITDELLKEMKACGVDHALVLPFPEGEMLASQPECLRQTVMHDNLHALGTIDPLKYTQDELKTLDELMTSRKICGLKLYPGYFHFSPQDKICLPIYKLCLKHDLPVIFHAGDTFGDETAKLKYSHPLNFDDLAADLPDLKIIIAHLGSPWLTDTSEVLYKNPNVYADVSGLFYSERQPGSKYADLLSTWIQDLMLFASPRKLIFGSDWPLHPLASYIKFVQSLKIGPKDLEYIMYKNAANLFKIKL